MFDFKWECSCCLNKGALYHSDVQVEDVIVDQAACLVVCHLAFELDKTESVIHVGLPLQILVELIWCCRLFTTLWSQLLVKAAKLIKHLVLHLCSLIKLFPDRIDRFWQWLNIRLKVSLALHRWSRYFGRFGHGRSRSPVLASSENFFLYLLFLCFELACLLLSHEVFAHALFALAYVEVCHVVTHDLTCVRLGPKCGVFLFMLLGVSHLLLLIQF